MEAYKFKTTIQEGGVIKVPEMAQWEHQRVEVFVVIDVPTEQEIAPAPPIADFINKWRGFMKGSDPDQAKATYLQEKYG